ncbi:MAG: hypothetical protein ACMXX6_01435 [Candidatus Woesearchaeota archaeon]
MEKLSKTKQSVKLYSGFKGMKTAYNEMLNELNEGDTYRFFQIEDVALKRKEINLFLKNHHKKREEKKIKVKGIVNVKSKETAVDILEKYKLVDLKVTNKQTPTGVIIYSNKVMLIDIEENPVVILIESEKISKNYVDFFEEIWNEEITVLKGLEAMKEIFKEMLEAGSCDYIGARGYLMDYAPDFIKNYWVPTATKTSFKMRNIVDKEVKGHIITTFPFAKTKYTLNRSFAHLSVFWIYRNNVVIANWEGKEPTAIKIQTKEVVEMHKKQFEVLWNKK